jgi:hypothetical protein
LTAKETPPHFIIPAGMFLKQTKPLLEILSMVGLLKVPVSSDVAVGK